MPLPPRAAEIDTLYQRDCARLDRDAPWSATFDLDLGDRVVTYRISPKRIPDERERDAAIIGFAHPLAAAYYEHRPGDEFELEHPRFASLSGTVVERTVPTASGRRLVAIDIARVGEQGRCVRSPSDDGFELEDRTAPIATRSVEGLPDIRALLTPESIGSSRATVDAPSSSRAAPDRARPPSRSTGSPTSRRPRPRPTALPSIPHACSS